MAQEPAWMRPVFLDALNFLEEFFDLDAGVTQIDPWGELYRAHERIAGFVQAFRASGFSLTIVVDKGTKSAGAAEKWRIRRETELRQRHRRTPLALDVFVCEAFVSQGVRAICPRLTDADDVLAALAFCNDGMVVSRDGDFVKCYDRPLRVAKSWQNVNGRIQLLPGTVFLPKYPTRSVQPELAERAKGSDWEYSPEMNYRPSTTDGRTTRGTTSSSDATMGNLHRLTAPLRSAEQVRAAVYWRLHEPGAQEIYPEWDTSIQNVKWADEHLEPDPALDPVLDDVKGVLAWIRERERPLDSLPQEGLRIERAFNQCVMAAELVAAASQGAELVAAASQGALTGSKAMEVLRPHGAPRQVAPSYRAPASQSGQRLAMRSRASEPGSWRQS